MSNPTDAPYKQTSFIARDIAIDRRDDGSILMSSRIPLELVYPNLLAYLRYRSEERPDAVWISEPDRISGNWRSISYAEARRSVDCLTQALIDLSLPVGSSRAIIRANSIEHALVTYAA